MVDFRVALIAICLAALAGNGFFFLKLIKRHRENMASDRRFRKAYSAMLEQMEGIPSEVSELWGEAIERAENSQLIKSEKVV